MIFIILASNKNMDSSSEFTYSSILNQSQVQIDTENLKIDNVDGDKLACLHTNQDNDTVSIRACQIGTGLNYSFNTGTNTGTLETKTSDIRSLISATSPLTYDNTTGIISATKDSANGFPTLDSSGLLRTNQFPLIAINEIWTVASEVAQLALTAEEGDIAVRTDENKSYCHNGGTAGTMSDWTWLRTPTDLVLSVNGQTGVVVLDTDDVSDTTSTNKYFTNTLARGAFSVGSNGLSYNSTTGVFDISTTSSPLIKGLSVAVFAPTFSALSTDGLVKTNSTGVLGNVTIGAGLSYSAGTLSSTSAIDHINGTANQIIVTESAPNITLSTPQDIGTSSTPTFGNLTAKNIIPYYKLTSSPNGTNTYYIGANISDSVDGGIFIGKNANATSPLMSIDSSGNCTFNNGITVGTGACTYGAGSLGYSDANWGFLHRPPRVGALAGHCFMSYSGARIAQIEDSNGAFTVFHPTTINKSVSMYHDGTNGIIGNSTGDLYLNIYGSANTVIGSAGGSATRHNYYYGGSHTFGVGASNTTAMSIDSSGNLTATAPTQTTTLTSTTYTLNPVSNTDKSKIVFRHTDSDKTAEVASFIRGGSAYYTPSIAFRTKPNYSTALADRMIINESGDITMGVSSQFKWFENGVNPYCLINSSSGVSTGIGSIGSTYGNVGCVSNHPFKILTNNTSRMEIDTNGKVTIQQVGGGSSYGLTLNQSGVGGSSLFFNGLGSYTVLRDDGGYGIQFQNDTGGTLTTMLDNGLMNVATEFTAYYTAAVLPSTSTYYAMRFANDYGTNRTTIVTKADLSTTGDTFTVLKSGIYALVLNWQSTSSHFVALARNWTKNTALTTTNVNTDTILAFRFKSNAITEETMSWTGYLTANDVITVQMNTTAPAQITVTNNTMWKLRFTFIH